MSRVLLIAAGGIVVVGAAGAAYMLTRPPERPAPLAIAPVPRDSAPAPTTPKAAESKPAITTPRPSAPTPAPSPATEAKETLGTLIIESDVPDTSVFIDRVYLGTAPVTAKNLTPGSHHLNMSVT